MQRVEYYQIFKEHNRFLYDSDDLNQMPHESNLLHSILKDFHDEENRILSYDNIQKLGPLIRKQYQERINQFQKQCKAELLFEDRKNQYNQIYSEKNRFMICQTLRKACRLCISLCICCDEFELPRNKFQKKQFLEKKYKTKISYKKLKNEYQKMVILTQFMLTNYREYYESLNQKELKANDTIVRPKLVESMRKGQALMKKAFQIKRGYFIFQAIKQFLLAKREKNIQVRQNTYQQYVMLN